MKLLWLSALMAVSASPASTRVDANRILSAIQQPGCKLVAEGDVIGGDWAVLRCTAWAHPAVKVSGFSACKLGFGTKPIVVVSQAEVSVMAD